MPKRYRHVLEVAVRHRFPIDMLRYERAYPLHEADSNRIQALVEEDQRTATERVVSVAKVTDDKNPSWGTARWTSFGCTIMNERTEQA